MILFATLNSGCPNGPKVTGCVVDPTNHGFQCADAEDSFFLPFIEGAELRCTSPEDLEDFLKKCKHHEVLPITLCQYYPDSFVCTPPYDASSFIISIDAADGYYCMSKQDWKRTKDRCD